MYKDQQFKVDLVDMSHLSKYNDGYRYLLTCIDVLLNMPGLSLLKIRVVKMWLKLFSRFSFHLEDTARNCTHMS